MSSDTPQANPWLERSRLDGMSLGAVSYGVFFLLTVQTATALMQRPRHGRKIEDRRLRVVLLSYVIITFVLATIGFAANARYTEMIWIDLRDAPGGPVELIEDEMNYPINVVAISCYFVMEWFMQALLLHRCFVIWNWTRYVIIPMTTLYIVMITMSILVLVQSSAGAIWYNINTQLIYLCLSVGLSVIYTVLVTNRLFLMRGLMKEAMEEFDSSIYDAVILMIIESAMLYSACAIVFIVSFGLHSNVSNLCFLSISHVQGIAQLLIIIRVARGRAIACERSTPVAAVSTSIPFSGTACDATEETNLERIAGSEQDGVELHSFMAEATEAEVLV